MYSKFTTISPTEAALWLDTKNSNNRPVSQSTVERYIQEIRQGNWKCNGQPVIFNKSGQLANGQHRLKAIVAANKSIETLIVWGIDDDAFDTIDDGSKRSLGDVFAIKGEGHPNLLSSGVRFLWVYATGQIATRDLRKGKIATKKLLEETLNKHPGLRQSTKFYSLLKSRPGGLLIPAGMAIGLHYLFALVDEKKADEFFNVLQVWGWADRGASDSSPSRPIDFGEEGIIHEPDQLGDLLLHCHDMERFRFRSAIEETGIRAGCASA